MVIKKKNTPQSGGAAGQVLSYGGFKVSQACLSKQVFGLCGAG